MLSWFPAQLVKEACQLVSRPDEHRRGTTSDDVALLPDEDGEDRRTEHLFEVTCGHGEGVGLSALYGRCIGEAIEIGQDGHRMITVQEVFDVLSVAADSSVVESNYSLKPVQRLGSCRFQAQVSLESPDLGSACCVPYPPQERQQKSHEENLQAELNKRRRAIDPQSG